MTAAEALGCQGDAHPRTPRSLFLGDSVTFLCTEPRPQHTLPPLPLSLEPTPRIEEENLHDTRLISSVERGPTPSLLLKAHRTVGRAA